MLLRSGATLLAGILLAGLFVSASSATSVPVGSVTTAGTGLPDSVSRVHAQAAGDPAGVVSAVPSASTPDVEDGAVLDIAVVGSTAVAVGSFSRVTSAVGDTSVARDSVVAFDGACRTWLSPGTPHAWSCSATSPTRGAFAGARSP